MDKEHQVNTCYRDLLCNICAVSMGGGKIIIRLNFKLKQKSITFFRPDIEKKKPRKMSFQLKFHSSKNHNQTIKQK